MQILYEKIDWYKDLVRFSYAKYKTKPHWSFIDNTDLYILTSVLFSL